MFEQTVSDGPYIFQYGELWFKDSTSQLKRVCSGSTEFALAVDTDGWVLHKHGPADRVSEWASKMTRAFEGSDLANGLLVIGFPITDETIAELNACINCTGRVKRFQDELEKIGTRMAAESVIILDAKQSKSDAAMSSMHLPPLPGRRR